MPDSSAAKAIFSLHRNRCLSRVTPIMYQNGRHQGETEPGRADVFVLFNGYGRAVVIKNADISFSFSQWRDNQREWYKNYAIPAGVPYWFWLVIGPHMPRLSADRWQPRKAWLFPAETFLEIEKMVSPIQNTLVYKATKRHREAIREQGLDAIPLLSD